MSPTIAPNVATRTPSFARFVSAKHEHRAHRTVGPAVLWTAPVTFPMMFAVVYLSAKLGQVTGKGLLAVIRDHFSRRVLWISLTLGVDSRHQEPIVSNIDTMPRSTTPDLLPGTLDLLILRTLQADPMHGWAISERIQQISDDVLQINQGSLYPALHRLEHQGWIEAEWRVSELGRRAKYYRLTASGRRQLAVEATEWARMAAAIDRVMKFA